MKITDPKLKWVPAISRCGIGLVVLLQAYLSRNNATDFTDPHQLHLPYAQGIADTLEPIAPLLMPVCAVAALLFVIGIFSRPAAVVMFVTLGAFLLADEQNYLNHVVFYCCLVLICAICGGLSARAPREERALLTLAFAVQMSLIYGFAALNKITPGYLSGDDLGKLVHGPIYTRLLEGIPHVDGLLAIAAIASEILLALGPWLRRVPKVFLLVLCAVFHLMILALVSRTIALVGFGGAAFAAYWGALSWRDNQIPAA